MRRRGRWCQTGKQQYGRRETMKAERREQREGREYRTRDRGILQGGGGTKQRRGELQITRGWEFSFSAPGRCRLHQALLQHGLLQLLRPNCLLVSPHVWPRHFCLALSQPLYAGPRPQQWRRRWPHHLQGLRGDPQQLDAGLPGLIQLLWEAPWGLQSFCRALLRRHGRDA